MDARMFRLNPAALSLTLLLGACGGTVNRGVESVHQPVVQRTDYAMDVTTGYAGALAPGERERLDAWFDAIALGFGDRVAIADPSGTDGGRQAVSGLLGRRGMMLADTAPGTAGSPPAGMIRIIVSRAAASVPGCPDWSRAPSPDFAGNTPSNYGCAINGALARMIANPHDLIEGREAGRPADGFTSSKAIRAYRAAPPTGAQGIKSETTRGAQ